MKQAQNLTAGTIIGGTFCWSSLIRPVSISYKNFRDKIIGRLPDLRSLLFSVAMILMIGGVFLTGSYLFLVQLAKYGW